MTEIDIQNDLHDDDDWKTFQYVAGELTLSQQHEFEMRLESDQTLREQVAKMVSRLAVVSEAIEPSLSPQAVVLETGGSLGRHDRPTLLRPVLRIFISVAALIAVAVFLTAMTNRADSTTADSVAVAWADSLEEESLQEFAIDFEEYELAAIEPTIALESQDDSDWIFDAVVAVEAMEN